MSTSTLSVGGLAGNHTPVRWWRRVPLHVLIAAAIFIILLLLAVGAEIVRPVDEQAVDLNAVLLPPSAAHPLGTDEVGRDLLARVLHGLRISFGISLLAALTAVIAGGLLGLAAGTLGGWVDAVVMRIVDLFSAQNHMLFGILLVVLFRPMLGATGAVMLSVGLTHWPGLARITRGELLALRERPFVAAAINGGADRWRLAHRHYLPHLLPAVGLGLILLLPHAIFHESALSFLGLGLPPHQASLGNILADGRRSLLAGGWWTSLFPGLLIFLLVLTIGTIGEYVRDRLNPRWRSELEL